MEARQRSAKIHKLKQGGRSNRGKTFQRIAGTVKPRLQEYRVTKQQGLELTSTGS